MTAISTSPEQNPAASAATCPLCGSAGRELFRKHGCPIQECSCGHRFAQAPQQRDQHVQTVYGDNYFFGGGAGYEDYLSEGHLLRQHGARYGQLLKRFAAPGRLLDVGAAAGFILQGFQDQGWQGRGVEPNPTVAKYARDQLGQDVTASTLENFQSDEPFDLVTVIQVLGHFVDPRAAVQALARLTKPGGLCLIETWNVRSWSARLFGANWHEYSPPSVLQWFSPTTVRRLFENSGFETAGSGTPRKWLNVGHARSLLAHNATESVLSRIASTALRAVPDRINLPYPSEDLFWMLFRKRA